MTLQPRPDPAPHAADTGTVLAFDFGLKRVGVAVGEMSLRQAHPLTTIEAEANDVRFAAIGALVDEWRPARLVVGLPRSLEGEEHELSARCRRFANQLHGRYGLPVDLVDERLTSVEAESRLRTSRAGNKRSKAQVDALAAQLILQAFLDAAT